MKRLLTICFFVCACLSSQAQTNIITTIAGKYDSARYNGDGIPALVADFCFPSAICFDKSGNLYIADQGSDKVRKITISTGIISTVAGLSTAAGADTFGYTGDNILATNTALYFPADVFLDSTGNIFIADGYNNRIRKVNALTGIITTVAGIDTAGATGDGGPATNAALNAPSGVCVDKSGNIYIADWGNNKIRKVTIATGIITTIAGTGAYGFSGNGGPATDAQFDESDKVYLDNNDNVFIADQWNAVVWKVDAVTGVISIFAGNGFIGYSGDNGPATDAELSRPTGIYIDKQNNVFFAEFGNGVIRRVDAVTGTITTVAGTGVWGYSGDNGPATAAQMIPESVCFDSYGSMFIADMNNQLIRKVYNPTLGVASPRPSPKERVTLLPNPARDEVTVEGAAGSEVSIYNMAGQEVYHGKILSDKQTFNIACISPGVYEVRIINSSAGLWITRKLVIAQ